LIANAAVATAASVANTVIPVHGIKPTSSIRARLCRLRSAILLPRTTRIATVDELAQKYLVQKVATKEIITGRLG
jgi:hypothetical protein